MYIIFSKISLFTFLIHLELINYFPCVTLACILLSLQIDAQGLHIDEKVEYAEHINMADDDASWIQGKSHHWTVRLVVDLAEDMVSRKS